jgi:hypothetical protein
MAETTNEEAFHFGDQTYKRMKFAVQVLLPALSTLYFALGAIWDLPYIQQVIGTLAAISAFLGVLVGLSAKNFSRSDQRFDGHIDIQETGTGKVYSLVLNTDPEEIDQKDEVLFRVDHADTPQE